jgi:hypothetical protein
MNENVITTVLILHQTSENKKRMKRRQNKRRTTDATRGVAKDVRVFQVSDERNNRLAINRTDRRSQNRRRRNRVAKRIPKSRRRLVRHLIRIPDSYRITNDKNIRKTLSNLPGYRGKTRINPQIKVRDNLRSQRSTLRGAESLPRTHGRVVIMKLKQIRTHKKSELTNRDGTRSEGLT